MILDEVIRLLNKLTKLKMLPAYILFPFVLLAVFVNTGGANFWNDWFNPDFVHGPSFKDSQLYNVDVGLDSISGSIGCFGDFNSDKYTDTFVISEDRLSVTVYLWQYKLYKYSPTTAVVHDNNITSIAAGDFNYDGKLDLLVSGFNPPNNVSLVPTAYLHLWTGNYDSFGDSATELPPSDGDVLVFDANADLQLDLFGTQQNQRSFWINKQGSFSVLPQPDVPESGLALQQPNANAFVDMDGDCLADLFVTSQSSCENVTGTCTPKKQFEIWLNKKGIFELDKTFSVPDGAGQVAFADFDRSGTMDLLFPVCQPYPSCSDENSLFIVYNIQKPLCKGLLSKSDSCRPSDDLCTSDPNYKLANMTTLENSWNTVVVPKEAFGYPDSFFYPDPRTSALTLRHGDYNLDGYPDLLVPVVSNGKSRVELYKSVPCNSQTCGSAAAEQNMRTFEKVTEDVDALTSVENAYAAAFIDFGEDGLLDIVVLTQNESQQSVVSIYNNFFNDAFFLKVLGSNGVCPGWCPSPGKKFPEPKPYGVNFPGAVWKYTVNELSGAQRVAQGVQLHQSGYLALQTPYILFGLGRTNNYVEELYMGVPVKSDQHWSMWICIIPNSQVVYFPYKPEDPESWTLELYIESSGVTLWVMVAFASSLIILGALIGFFRWREKKEDRLAAQQTIHLFAH
eukprot:TRINITY_DN2316_c0_g1_i2.p1 TRINITY_DN2316_c0_g1~~TRINITY_DN2316_c0_g1_i2.p1  ORF type:complete len:678 (+),score=117.31 TRINITY_DN2316_c0_g1_i2:215-2248(+)